MFDHLSRAALVLLAALLLAGCGPFARSGMPPRSTTATTGCPDALGPITAPIVAAAGENLVATDARGGGTTWLLSLSPDASAAFPAWSPDGQTLAYALRYRSPAPKLRDVISVICGIDRASGKGRLLAQGIQDDWLDEPTWAPDGRALLLTLNRYQTGPDQQPVDTRSVVRYDLAAGALQVLIADAHSPALSPDGSRLAYIVADRERQIEVIYVARPDGQDARQLFELQWPYVNAMWPRWSPDGTQLAFGIGLVGGDEDERYAVAMVGADGQGFRQLGKDVNNFISIDWAADGRQIAYVSSGPGMFVRDLAQDELRNLMQAGDGTGISWLRQ